MKKIALTLTAALVLTLFAAPAGGTGKVIVLGTHAAGNYIPWWGNSYDSCRFQCMWLQSEINTAGYINQIEFEPSGSYNASFNEVRVWLCHTTKTQLEGTFNNNYSGTPVQVRSGGTLTFSGSGYTDIGITPGQFNYNNSDNLLLEIRWNGDSGVGVPCYRSSASTGRIYAWDHNASSGTVQVTGQCVRIHMGTMTGVLPTSLGRVKSLFQ